MTIRFVRNVAVDAETRSGEVSDKSFYAWQEVRVNEVFPAGNFATIKLTDGTILHGVPVNSFEKLTEEKKVVKL